MIARVFLLLALSGFTAIAAERPNILFILADDMGWQDTSVPFAKERTKFNDRFRTPALERLAREGVKFTQAYSCAVCSPTRVSFLTGQNTPRHGVTQWTHLTGDKPTSDLPHPTLSHAAWNWSGLQPAGTRLPHSVEAPTLPALFKAAGYRTMHLGKGHFGAAGTPGADPKVFGFDVRIGGRDAGGCGSYSGLKNFGAQANPDGPWRAWDLDHFFGQDIHLTEALTLEAKREIRSAAADGQPFFCYFAHYAPHTPIEPDERFAPKYRAAGLNETEAAYASLIEGMDKSVGDLLALLDELGIADNTLVVFTSDNGAVSHKYRTMDPPHTHNRPLSSGKGAHHEGGIRVPLLVRWPGENQAASVNETPVAIYDWFPTLMKVAGALAPDHLDGLDLTPLLSGAKAPATFDRPLVWHFPNFWGPLSAPSPVEGPGLGPSSVIRKGEWKLIYYHGDEHFELFNLANDLGEMTNLAAQKPECVRELAAELAKILRQNQAPMPVVKATGKPVPYPNEIRP
jgi:arylsulfatase A-like enzyme